MTQIYLVIPKKVLLDRTDEEQRASLSGKFIAARYEQSLPFPKQIILWVTS